VAFIRVKTIAEKAAGMSWKMLEVRSHPVASGLMRAHAPMTFRATLQTTRIQPH
jgi:hypothetical protein